MAIRFKHHNSLRLFVAVAGYGSFTIAAENLHVTKGAISSQIKNLENQLGGKLFERSARGTELTMLGQHVLAISQSHYQDIESELDALTDGKRLSLTVGLSTYFASRWLSAKLMIFMQQCPDIQLRLQPMTQLNDLEQQGVDIAIRWGRGEWTDVDIIPLMQMPAWAACNQETARNMQKTGLKSALEKITLLRDTDSSNVWSDWHDAAGFKIHNRRESLIIPDPNVRVQAVIDGQGIALLDDLALPEVANGKLVRFSPIQLDDFGYFLALPELSNTDTQSSVCAFVEWIQKQCPSVDN